MDRTRAATIDRVRVPVRGARERQHGERRFIMASKKASTPTPKKKSAPTKAPTKAQAKGSALDDAALDKVAGGGPRRGGMATGGG